jgi:cold shock CspA family protein
MIEGELDQDLEVLSNEAFLDSSLPSDCVNPDESRKEEQKVVVTESASEDQTGTSATVEDQKMTDGGSEGAPVTEEGKAQTDGVQEEKKEPLEVKPQVPELPLPEVNPDDYMVLDTSLQAAAEGVTSTGKLRTMGPSFGFISPDDDVQPLFTHFKHVKLDCDLSAEPDPFLEWMKGQPVEFKRIVLAGDDAHRECAVLVTGPKGKALRFPLSGPGKWRHTSQRKQPPRSKENGTKQEWADAEIAPWSTGVITKFSSPTCSGVITCEIEDQKKEEVYVHLYHMTFDVDLLHEGFPYVEWLIGQNVRF